MKPANPRRPVWNSVRRSLERDALLASAADSLAAAVERYLADGDPAALAAALERYREAAGQAEPSGPTST